MGRPPENVQFKALNRHMNVHAMSLRAYREKYKDPDTGAYPPTGMTIQTIRPPGVVPGQPHWTAPRADGTTPTAPPPPRDENFLSLDERAAYDERFKTLFDQADNDPALVGMIKTLVLNEINIARYNNQINRLNMPTSAKGTHSGLDVERLRSLSKLVKELTATNLSLMRELSLTRKEKIKDKKTVDTTPARLMAGFEVFLKNNDKRTIDKIQMEMDEAAAAARRNLAGIKTLVPEDAIVEETDSDTDWGDSG
jgi:hypothetical protein